MIKIFLGFFVNFRLIILSHLNLKYSKIYIWSINYGRIYRRPAL